MPETLPHALEGRPEGRPFPWPCPRCRKKTVWLVVIPYRSAVRYEGKSHTVEVLQLNADYRSPPNFQNYHPSAG